MESKESKWEVSSKSELTPRKAVMEMYAFTKAHLGGAIDDMFSDNRDLLLETINDLELYKSLYNEALNHLEITLGQDKETIDKLLRKVVNGE